jgi:hypothetical protein
MAIHGNICGSQVLVHNDMLDIPNKNILKRWMVIAGASIPTPNEGEMVRASGLQQGS